MLKEYSNDMFTKLFSTTQSYTQHYPWKNLRNNVRGNLYSHPRALYSRSRQRQKIKMSVRRMKCVIENQSNSITFTQLFCCWSVGYSSTLIFFPTIGPICSTLRLHRIINSNKFLGIIYIKLPINCNKTCYNTNRSERIKYVCGRWTKFVVILNSSWVRCVHDVVRVHDDRRIEWVVRGGASAR